MFGSSALEVAIGVVFIYLLLSLICSALNEGISSLLNKRGTSLLEGVKNLLSDSEFTGLAHHVYNHGMVGGISQNACEKDKATRLPSYIHANNFSLALVDILGATGAIASGGAKSGEAAEKLKAAKAAAVASAENPKSLTLINKSAEALHVALAAGRTLASHHADPLGTIQAGVKALPDGHAKESLLVLIEKTRRETLKAENQVQAFQNSIDDWFNEAMTRVGGWYKRWTQLILLILSFLVVFTVNADTLMLVDRLTMDSAVRASLVNAAQDAVRLSPPENGAPDTRVSTVLNSAKALRLPLGWTLDLKDPRHIPLESSTWDFSGWLFLKILGLLISVFAVSMGAPFWFDLLSKFVNIRGSGAPPSTAKKAVPQVA